MKKGRLLKNLILAASAFIFTISSAMAYTIGTGSTSGVFYPTGLLICGKASEAFLDCTAQSTGGSTYNVNAVQNGEFELGLAMKKVALESGLQFTELQIGEGAFIAVNETVAKRVKNMVGGIDAAVFPAALRLAAKGRVTFITIGKESGETAILQAQLQEVGAPASALITVADEAGFIQELKSRDNAFGFFTRIPKPDNAIFIAIDEAKLQIIGAFNPAFKDPSTTLSTVEVAGFTVKTPVSPVTIIYKEETADIKELVTIASSIVMEDLVPKKSGFMAFISKWSSKIKKISSEKASELSALVQEKVDQMNL